MSLAHIYINIGAYRSRAVCRITCVLYDWLGVEPCGHFVALLNLKACLQVGYGGGVPCLVPIFLFNIFNFLYIFVVTTSHVSGAYLYKYRDI